MRGLTTGGAIESCAHNHYYSYSPFTALSFSLADLGALGMGSTPTERLRGNPRAEGRVSEALDIRNR